MSTAPTSFSLLVRAGDRRCALPLTAVVETMRPLRLQALPSAPAFVLGVATIRGEAVPVVDLDALLGDLTPSVATRLVVLKIGDHQVAVAVSEVIGVHEHDRNALRSLPSLAGEAGAGAAVLLERLDGQFLMVLDSARLIPADMLDDLMKRSTELLAADPA